jgi:hypothetical protein
MSPPSDWEFSSTRWVTGLDQPLRATRRVRRRRLGATTDGSAGGGNRCDGGDTNCSDHDEEFERDDGRQRLVTRRWAVETVTKPVPGVVDGVHGKDVPTDYYPFDAEKGDRTQCCIYMLNAAIQLAGEYGSDPFNVDELLAGSHKLWSSMSGEKRKELRTWGGKFLDKYIRKELDEGLWKV